MPRSPSMRCRLSQLVLLTLGLCLAEPSRLGAQEPPSQSLVRTKLVPSTLGESDQFGHAIAMSGDLLVSTAPDAIIDARTSAGAVHVFRRDPAAASGWTEQKRLLPLPLDSVAFDQFGMTVAIHDDTLVVGAPNAKITGVFQQGAVHVFERHHGGTDNWGEVVRLVDGSIGSGGHFGSSVALEGDLLAVGADLSATGRNGQVTLFERNRGGAGSWGKITTLQESVVNDGGSLELFGSAVALGGDLLLVGARRADVSGTFENDGAAYLFRRDPSAPDTWNYVSRLIAPGADLCPGGRTLAALALESAEIRDEAARCAREDSNTDNNDFGFAVALADDTIAIGASSSESGTINSAGAVHVFRRDASTADRWNWAATLAAGDPTSSAYFGRALAMAGDTILVGAHGAKIGTKAFQGAVYVFGRNQGGPDAWGQAEKLIASDGFGGGYFGQGVAFDGQARIIGSSGDVDGRGAVYLPDAVAGTPPPPPGCQPPFVLTGELVSASVITGPAGVKLGAVENSLSQPVRVWIHEVGPPPEPLFSNATVRGAHYNLGAECTTFASRGAPFVLALPVPDTADTTRLGVAVLASAESVLDGAVSGRSWQPATGFYDSDRRLYIITLSALAGDGSTFVLVEHPDLAPAKPGRVRREEEDVTPSFDAQCFGFDGGTTCGFVQEASVGEALRDAYLVYKGQGFLDPALSNTEASLGADELFHVVTHPTLYKDIFIRPSAVTECGSDAGRYHVAAESISICVDPAVGIPSEGWLRTVVRHELFHAVQYAYPAVRAGARDDWVIEGTAEAATRSDVVMRRSPTEGWFREWRLVNVELTHERGDEGTSESLYPYETQDFWVYLFQANQRNLNLGELASFFGRGATTGSVADRMENPPTLMFYPLGLEYWDWVKNQVIEKRVTFEDTLLNPCQIERDTSGYSNLTPAAISWPALPHHVYGSLENLQSAVVKIAFTERMPFGTILAEKGGNGEGLKYKVYVEGEEQCRDMADGELTVRNLPKGSIVYVVLSNIEYRTTGVLSPLYKVLIRGG
jgi:FG-GAP repeat